MLKAGGQFYLPGGQPLQMPEGLNQQTAGFTPDQLAAMGMIGGQTGAAGGLAGMGAGLSEATMGGEFLDPSTNPWLRSTYNEAAKGVTDQYSTATAPSMMAAGETATGGGPGGLSGSSAFNTAMAQGQYGLGQNLQNLATNIYGGNYQQERQNQLATLGMLPQTQSALYQPANELLGVGSLQQQQQQTELDTLFQNALRQFQTPMMALSGMGSLLGQATGGAGNSVSVNPNPLATK